jgi:hypothetical protein
LGSYVDASEISGNSTQKLPGQSPKNAKMAAATSETSIATPSSALPSSAPREANVNAYEISGDSSQKLLGQSPSNAEVAAAATETTTASPSTGHPPSTSVEENVDASDIWQ